MIIKSIEIDSFGGLSDFRIDLCDGFNLIFGANGKGKSTLMAFIKMMLFSKLGNEKSGDLLKNPRRKYLPLDGSPMSGAIVFEHNGSEYRLHKTFGKSPSTDKTKLWSITKGEAVPLSSLCEVGEILLGMSAAEFERSVFIDSTDGFSPETKDFGLETRISNLASTGEEATSQRIVLDRITAAKEELISKSGKKGLIANLEAEIALLQNQKASLLAQINEQAGLSMQIAQLENEILRDEQKLQSLGLAQETENCKRELDIYKLLFEKLGQLTAAKDSCETYSNRVKNARLCRRSLISILIALISGVIFVISGTFINKRLYTGLILSIAAIIYSVYSRLLGIKAVKADLKYDNTAALKHDIETIARTASINPDIAFNADIIKAKIKNLTAFIENNSAVSADKGITPNLIREKHNTLNGLYKRQTMPAVSVEDISAELSDKSARLKKLKSRYESLCIAEKIMEEAVAETDSSLGAFLSRRTEEYLRVQNKGKGIDVLVSDSLDIELKNTDDSRYYQWKYLSRGYIDRTYFALRLALADASVKDNSVPPLLLDDILAQYDEEGCEGAMLLLKNRLEANGGQVLFFTCHKNILHMAKEIFQNLGELYI